MCHAHAQWCYAMRYLHHLVVDLGLLLECIHFGNITSTSSVTQAVSATVPNPQFSSGSGLEPNWNCCNWINPVKILNRTDPAVFWLVPHVSELRTCAPIKYLSSDHITIWYIRTICSFGCSFSTHPPIGNPISNHWVTAKNTHFSVWIHSNSMHIDWIANWRTGGDRASQTSSFTYISYCDTIRTQIRNWNQSSESTKRRVCYMEHRAVKWLL